MKASNLKSEESQRADSSLGVRVQSVASPFWESEAPNIRVSRRAEMERDEPGPMAGIRCAVERK